MPQIDTIDPKPQSFKLVTTKPEPDLELTHVEPREIYIEGLSATASAPRGAAIADATDAASVITRVNAILAYLRASGHIAP